MKIENELKMVLQSRSLNESFARVAVAAFVAQLDPTVEEITDVKTAVSEAVTNCIVHAYGDVLGKIYVTVQVLEHHVVKIIIRDKGKGIENIEKAMEPLYTTAGEERAGLGFAVMQSFCDRITVRSKPNKGTTVTLYKSISYKVRANGGS